MKATVRVRVALSTSVVLMLVLVLAFLDGISPWVRGALSIAILAHLVLLLQARAEVRRARR